MPQSGTDLPFVFDGHNDMLLRLYSMAESEAAEAFMQGRADGHLDLPRMDKGGFGGGLFAVFVPSAGAATPGRSAADGSGYDMPLPPPIDQSEALPATLSMIATLLRLEAASNGRFRICRSVADIRAARADGAVAAVLHFEGAEAIDASFDALDVFHALGLRSLGLVWSRPTLFGHGVPFRFPGDPDTGEGLTAAGKALVRACNKRGIAVDLSHLNEKGFWDTARVSDAPLIASHSNSHAVCPHTRNLTDEQLRAIRDSGGIAGLNFGTYFLRPDGRASPDTGLDTMLAHIDHMIDVMGPEHVGIGTDFDGIRAAPRAIGDAAGLPALLAAMREHGYDDATVTALAHGNWLRVLETTWGG